MFYYTYLIENEKRNWYIGFTNNLKKRIVLHNKNKVYTTARMKGKWHIVYYEACLNEKDARQREKYLKSGRGWQYLKSRLKSYKK